MRTLIFTFILVINFSIMTAQSYDEKIAFVRKNFSLIEGNKNLTKSEYIYQPYENLAPVAYYYFWFDENENLVKAQKNMGEEGYSSEENYYFVDGKLIFYYGINSEPEYSDGGTFYIINESRIYFYNEVIFEHLYKVKEAFDSRKISDIPNEKGEWDIQMQKDLLKAADELKLYSKI